MNSEYNLKTVLIVGGSQGLGKQIAESFLKKNYKVIIAARNLANLEATFFELKNLNKEQGFFYIQCDISKKKSVEKMFNNLKLNFNFPEILINCAGIAGDVNNIQSINLKKWIEAVNINLIGTVILLNKYIKDALKNRIRIKVIQLSGGGATKPLPGLSSYSSSKAGVVRLIENISKEIASEDLDINCIAPGTLNTSLVEDMFKGGINEIDKNLAFQLQKQKKDHNSNLIKTIKLIHFLSSKKSNGISGKLISAVWDQWNDQELINKLKEDNDLFTLRRNIQGVKDV